MPPFWAKEIIRAAKIVTVKERVALMLQTAADVVSVYKGLSKKQVYIFLIRTPTFQFLHYGCTAPVEATMIPMHHEIVAQMMQTP